MANREFSVSSKFLSLVLRHKPELIDLKLDPQGWAEVGELIQKINENGRSLDFETLETIVETNEKNRFSFNEDKTKIRANQGHSVKIDLGLEPQIPPKILFHGTGEKSVESILKTGLQKRNRHHVHLSIDVPTAVQVGRRHGKPVVFEVLAEEMHNERHVFYVSDNGIWLTEEVPVKYLKRI